MKLPVFPLNAIVCPRGRIPLRIFEPRYIDMIRSSLRNDSPFVVTLLAPDERHSYPFYSLGTLVKIVDFGEMFQNGILTVVVEGQVQVKLAKVCRQDDGLWMADITQNKMEPFASMPEEFDDLSLVLKALIKHPFVKELDMHINFDDAREVSWRLTELLPLGNEQKQHLYELSDPQMRLAKIADQLSDLVE
jgi:Lon protease-like protein